jgi:biopolymer transport protein ExbD
MASKAAKDFTGENPEMQMTSLIDMAFLLIIFFICLPMKTLEGKIQAFLPTDKGINPTPTTPPLSLKVTVHILAREEKPALYPPTPPKGAKPLTVQQVQVKMPTKIVYEIGNEETTDLKAVYDYIKKGYLAIKDTPDAQITGEIKAGHKVPHKYVIAVLNKFAEAGMEKVDFYGTAIPPKNLRQLTTLPYPARNYGTSD